MPVVVDFTPILEEIEKAARRGAPAENAVQLENVLFDMPVHIRIEDVDLSPPSGAEPIIFLARAGPYIVRNLLVGMPQELRFPSGGELVLTLDRSGDVTMACPVRRRTAKATHRDLLEAWKRFAEDVKKFLLAEFPELSSHPELGAWFRGESD